MTMKEKREKISPKKIAFKSMMLAPADAATDRGRRTWDVELSGNKYLTFFYRKKNETFGNHFHTGKDESKKPEIFFLIFGVIDLYLMDQNGNKISAHLDASKNPMKFIIEPNIWHTFKAKTDVYYIEFRVTLYDPNNSDTWGWERFRAAASDPSRLPPIAPQN